MAVEFAKSPSLDQLEPLDTQHFTRNKFLELYDELAEREDIREAVPQIAGPASTPRLTAGTFKSLVGGKVPEGNPA